MQVILLYVVKQKYTICPPQQPPYFICNKYCLIYHIYDEVRRYSARHRYLPSRLKPFALR